MATSLLSSNDSDRLCVSVADVEARKLLTLEERKKRNKSEMRRKEEQKDNIYIAFDPLKSEPELSMIPLTPTNAVPEMK